MSANSVTSQCDQKQIPKAGSFPASSGIQQNTGTTDDTKSVIGDEYILVRKNRQLNAPEGIVKPPVKSGLNSADLANDLSIPSLKKDVLMTRQTKTKAGIKLPLVKTKLVYPAFSTSAANTANVGVFPVEPALSSEFASFAALYEECKVTGGTFHFDVSTNAAPITAGTEIDVVSYDPMSATALTSIADGLEDAQHVIFQATPVAGTLTNPRPVTANGLWAFNFKVPKGTARTTASAAVFGGSDWSLTADAADIYGYLKVYISALGAAITSLINGYVVLDVEFRSRL